MFYQAISANKMKTGLLMFVFFLVILALGWAIGFLWGTGGNVGLVIALIVAFLMIWGSYYHSDKIVIAAVGARPADKYEEPYLVNVVEGLSIAAGFNKPPKVYIMESQAMNAFATGRNPDNSAVCVTRGLLNRMDRQELEGVIAHELSHIRNYDTLIMTVTAVLVGGVAIFSQIMWRMMFFTGGRGGRRSGGGGGAQLILMIVAILLIILAPILVSLMKFALSRTREYLADASAVQLTRNPDGLRGALMKLSGDTEKLEGAHNAVAHLFISNPFKKEAISNAFSTHPPIHKRIEALTNM